MKRIILLLISIYRVLISPVLVQLFGHGCRFNPTCSLYAQKAVTRYGVKKGLRLSLLRLARCHRFSGGHYNPTYLF